jgi:shikimate kinase
LRRGKQLKPDGPIVITGFMGCGKTRVARELARRLDVNMIDLDDEIARRAGRSPAQLIVAEGEAAFRVVESETLRDVLHTGAAKVIALGGGAWIQEANRQLAQQYSCISVWLDAPFEMCWARIKNSEEDRPLGRTREQALALYKERAPVYELADVRVPAHDENLNDLIRVIRSYLIL